MDNTNCIVVERNIFSFSLPGKKYQDKSAHTPPQVALPHTKKVLVPRTTETSSRTHQGISSFSAYFESFKLLFSKLELSKFNQSQPYASGLSPAT